MKSKKDEYHTVSVPYLPIDLVAIRILYTRVYADKNSDTFPRHLVSSDASDEKNLTFLNKVWCRLKYNSLVNEDGTQNSMVRVRFVSNDVSNMHFGLMIARGTYLRRLINGSRHALSPYLSLSSSDKDEEMKEKNDTHDSEMFSFIRVEHVEHDTYDLFFQFRDFSKETTNLFEGHYRDVRVVLFNMPTSPSTGPVITTYEAGAICRVSPNKQYLPEKRVDAVVQELKWNEDGVPPAPPMMGVHPTMRIQFEKMV